MATKADRYTIFLMSAVLAADARPALGQGPALSLAKQARMNALLAERFPDRSAADRRALVKRALSGMPPISGGLAFLSLVEKTAGRLKGELSSPKEAAEILRQLVSIANAGGEVSPQERLVLDAALANIGLKGRAHLTSRGGQLALARSA